MAVKNAYTDPFAFAIANVGNQNGTFGGKPRVGKPTREKRLRNALIISSFFSYDGPYVYGRIVRGWFGG